jgi:hypothetical protein
MYLLAMCLPAIAAKSYYKTYLLHGWEVTYMCAVVCPVNELGERASFIVGPFPSHLGAWSWKGGFSLLAKSGSGSF